MDFSKIKTISGKISPTKLNSKQNQDLKNQIFSRTNFLPRDRGIAERIYCIENNINNIPTCRVTGKKLKWNANKKEYSQSKESSYKNRKLNFATLKQRYSQIYKKLNQKINNKEYNTISAIDCIQRFKYDHNIKAWDIEKDYDLFCSILHHTSFLPEKSKWGERIYCLRNNITSRPKSKDGGYSNFINSAEGYSKYSSRNNKQKLSCKEVREFIESKNFKIIGDIYNINEQYRVEIVCNKCNNKKAQLISCGHWKNVVCNYCVGNGRSGAEDEIIKFIKSLNDEEKIIANFKIPESQLEIDIYLPDRSIGIEFHGILWHSFGTTYPKNSSLEHKNKQKHSRKAQLSKDNNIQLIQIFESEWLHSRDIIESMIKSKFNIYEKKIYARKCEVKLLDTVTKKHFLEQNHIQGNCQSCDNLGLFYEDELVAVMTFSNRITKNKNQIELARFAVKQNYAVIGGFSKLLKNYNTNKIIISYCDLRYSTGDVYEKTGFKLLRQSPPNYFYTKDTIYLESRHKYQKKKLQKYPNFSHDKTETQIMYENGFRKIYDAGNNVYEFNSRAF